MIGIITFLVVLAISMLVTRVGSVALTLTGISQDLARFQARSAFTGVGFTTRESEMVVNHPVRRRILMLLMLLGNAGIVAVMSSFIISMASLHQFGGTGLFSRLALLVAGLAALCLLARSKWINRRLTRIIGWALHRWTRLDVRDYAGLLHLSSDYQVTEILVREGDWLANRRLAELELSREGFLVLGIQRQDGSYMGTPVGQSLIRPNDCLIVYGRERALAELDQRRTGDPGDAAHRKAVAVQDELKRREDLKERTEAEDDR